MSNCLSCRTLSQIDGAPGLFSNMRGMESGMKQITGFKVRWAQGDQKLHRANELNTFYTSFGSDQHSACSSPASSYTDLTPYLRPQPPVTLPQCPLHISHGSLHSLTNISPHIRTQWDLLCLPSSLCVSSSQEKRQLERLNQLKAAGTDGVSSRVLKVCAEQQYGILQHLFNLSLSQKKIPVLWKTSCLDLKNLILLPLLQHPTSWKFWRGCHCLPSVIKWTTIQDPVQVVYHPGVGVEDAIICLLHLVAHSHLDKAGSTVRIMFFDFSSAFTTIQPIK